MADVHIDISGEDGELSVVNPIAFDMQIAGCGLCIDMTHEQAAELYAQLGQFFGDDREVQL
ncbi:hypothetical protein [Stenotrophomonas maltophilia group sp. Smal13]|uniref:hypothetical protein n=1 Tax=Stenotrophomonas maltophilia group sp. Smal13 TaxID=3377166 RepID=UPI002556F094|nr:hypothetical protein [Stenotrophomonas maltophilia]